MKILIIFVCLCGAPDWEDSICNPDNLEYIIEVVENYNLQQDDLFLIQYFFVERYYETCTPKTREWFDCISYCDEILKYEQNFKCK